MITHMRTTEPLDLKTLRLAVGSHESLDDGMCVMEAVSYMAGEPWSDSPQCASPVIAAFLRTYNDGVDEAERQELKQYIPRLIGTRGSDAIEERRALIAADWLVRVYTPVWLRLAGLTAHADALSLLPEIISMAQCPSIQPAINAARRDAAAARAAAGDAVWAAARNAAGAAAGAAVWAAARNAAGAAAGAAVSVFISTPVFAVVAAAAGAAAWDAVWAAAARAAAGDAVWAAARNAAGAAWDALKPSVDALQATVPALIERMIAAGLTTIVKSI